MRVKLGCALVLSLLFDAKGVLPMSFSKFREAAKEAAQASVGDASPELLQCDPRGGGLGEEAVMSAGSKVVGKLSFDGVARLDGHVEGEINARRKLVIGTTAVINAKVCGGEIFVKGTVNGDICAAERLSLQKPARVKGNISTPSLSIEEGVFFEGSCKMTGDANSPK
mgnify:CR=1 FL=1